MSSTASQITGLTIVCSTVYSSTDQRKHHSSASLAFVQGIHRWPVNSPHKRPVTRKMFTFDDVIMLLYQDSVVHESPIYFQARTIIYTAGSNTRHFREIVQTISWFFPGRNYIHEYSGCIYLFIAIWWQFHPYRVGVKFVIIYAD